ncbi:Glyoxalase-like domain-containing protein [Bradyrhizobium sp. Rc3b]|uniref:VOC family protein n=1 Tax=Bradyrhizobium sp. Rc3b TaxID=1855322 RepID=UPI0008ECCA9D|nr:VOC family protein [Bradyrhizobium sp. Rc3b]SFN40633.1 Glyoxalase-like domain-containing protein [Bradyrhizobium sp. Rc3b]
MLRLDHITVAANDLAEGVAYVETALGIAPPAGGAHPLMGTHNHLLRLSETAFLEVIAPNPSAPAPSRPRWFALDDARTRAVLAVSPRLMTWVVSTSDITSALATIPHVAKPAITVTRGHLEWLISVPPDGSMPFDGAFPTVIEWPAGPHPASRMADLGCSLVEFEIRHPEADTIAASLAGFLDDPRIRFSHDSAPSFRAVIRTPGGDRQLV